MSAAVRLENKRTGGGVLVLPSYALAMWWARKQEKQNDRAGAATPDPA